MENYDISVELPRYKCNKIVRALKITYLAEPLPSGDCVFSAEDEKFGFIILSAEYMEKHKPKVGGYFVVYEDGYKSWSPAEAFENGYTRID